MSKPHIHARSSAKKFGGRPEDYIAIHKELDTSKAAHASVRHRAILHSAFGCFLIERIFGDTITNSDGKEVSVRDVAEQHILEDLGFIPSLDDWLDGLPIEPWMAGALKGRILRIEDKSERERVARRLLRAAQEEAHLPVEGNGPGPIFGRRAATTPTTT